MDEQVRIAIDIQQKAENGVPVKLALQTEDGRDIDIFKNPEDQKPMKSPVEIDPEGSRIFITEGGKFVAHFWWTATDKKEREFTEPVEIPIPPLCPGCEKRVPELVEGDYLCESCRFG